MPLMNWIKSKFKKREAVALGAGMVLMPSGMIAWGGSQYAPEYLLGLDVDRLQRRALQIWWESVHARGAINQLNTLTVNTGLRLQSTPNRRVLGISVEEAQNVSDNIESIFGLVRQQKTCSYDGRHTFNEMEIIGRKCWDVFGETFAILRYPRTGVNVQLINPLSVKNPVPLPKLPGNQKITRGIRFRSDKPVGFYVETTDKNGSVSSKYVPFVGESGRRVGIHCADIQTPDQVRGLTRLAPVFHEFRRILESLKYELDSMATNATVAMVITRAKPVVDAEKLKRDFTGVTTASVPTVVDEIDKENIQTTTGGLVMQNLEPGEEPKTLDTARPNVNIPVFIDKAMEWIGPAIGLPATVWKMLFSSNYSASRGELELAWKTFDVENYRFSTSFEQEYYAAVVNFMVGQGRVILRGWSDSWRRAAWLAAKWRGVPMPSLNPYQEAKAATERIRNYSSTHENEAQKATGTSFEANIERQLHEMRWMKNVKKIYDDAGIEFDVKNTGFVAGMYGGREYAQDMAEMYADESAA